ncbi:MAG: isochorismatase family protein [Phycisphaerae bacterium]|nr:isochorismatase family protein [Phycisphaerae bacterium]
MGNSSQRSSFNRILVDMNTQCDFLLPKGALPVVNRGRILPNIRRIMNWGRIEGVPIISSLECHRNGEPGNGLPRHCVDRSSGQKKLPFTLMPRRIILHGDNTLDLPLEPFRRYQQVIFTKRNHDFLSNPKADRLINHTRAKYIAVFGVLAEHCVKTAVLGLLARHRRVVVIRDACGYLSYGDAELAFRQMAAKGATLVTTEQLLSGEVDARLDADWRTPVANGEPASERPEGDNGNGGGNGRGDGRTVVHGRESARPDGNERSGSSRHDRHRDGVAHLLELRRRKGKPTSGRPDTPGRGLA